MLRLVALVLCAVLAFSPSVVATARPVHVLVDLQRCRLTLYLGYKPLRSFPVAVGKPSTPTPVGQWRIVEKAKWGEGFGSRWMQLSVPWGTYGVHGTDKPWLIGDAVSGGCIRMVNQDAQVLYDLVEVGTVVKVVGGPLEPLAELQTLHPGFAGATVLRVQQALRTAGLYRGPLDGWWSVACVIATRRLQVAHHVTPTGEFDARCYAWLRLFRFE